MPDDHRLGIGIGVGEDIAKQPLLCGALGSLEPVGIARLDDLLYLGPDGVPVVTGFEADLLFHGQYGIEEFRAGIEKLLLGLLADLEA